MMKKIVVSLIIPVIGLVVYFGLGILIPVTEPTSGLDYIVDEPKETIKEITISADEDYLSFSVNNIRIKVDAVNIQEKGGDK